MISHMVVGGCSVVWGDELKDRNSRFFKLIADRFNCELHDSSLGALNNEMICRYTMDLVNNLLHDKNISSSEILTCVNFSYAERLPFFNIKKNTMTKLYRGILKKSYFWCKVNEFEFLFPDEVVLYYNSMQSPIYLQYNLINWVYLLKLFLDSKNIKYIFSFVDDKTYELLKQDQTSLNEDQKNNESISVSNSKDSRMPILKYIQKDINYNFIFEQFIEKIITENKYPQGPRKHPLEKAHFEYSKLLGDFIQEKIFND